MKSVVYYYVKFDSSVNLCAFDICKAFDKMKDYRNLYSPTSGSKERNIQTYKYGDIPLLWFIY